MVLAQEKYPFDEQSMVEVQETVTAHSVRPSRVKRRRSLELKFGSKVFLSTIIIGLIFLTGIALAYCCIYPTRLGYQIVTLEQEIAALEQEQKLLKLRVAQAQSPERIEHIARYQLAMIPAEEGGGRVIESPAPASSGETGNDFNMSEGAALAHDGINETQVAVKAKTGEQNGPAANPIILTTAQVISDKIMAIADIRKPKYINDYNID